jgi:hypothetical protein
MEASGKLGNCLVFAKWKGRAYARSLVKPHNPKLPAQVGIRAMMRFLSQVWKTLSAPNQTTWDALAEATNISPFNAYIAYNMRRWRSGNPPTKTYPADEESDALTVSDMTTVGAPRHVDVSLTPSADTDIWGFVLCRSQTTGFTPSWANCIRVLDAAGPDEITWVDAPLDAGVYYYRAAVINVDGVIGAYHAQTTATVT